MRRSLLLVLTLAPALALASDAHHGPVGPDWSSVLRHSINLVVLLAALGFAARKPLADFLSFRRKEVQEQLAAAERARAEAEARAQALQARLAGFDRELAELRSTMAAEAEAERKALLAQAAQSAAQTEAAAKRAVDDAVLRARSALRDEAVELAVGVAEGLLAAQVDKKDQDRLHQDFLARLEGSAR